MSLTSKKRDGYYDENGTWRRLKHCFVPCKPDRYTCRPPFGVYQKKPKEETETKEEISKS